MNKVINVVIIAIILAFTVVYAGFWVFEFVNPWLGILTYLCGLYAIMLYVKNRANKLKSKKENED